MKRSFFLIILLALAIISCSPIPKITIVDTSCSEYKSNDFVREDISKNGIGIMSVVGGAEKEQYRRPMGEAITKYMKVQFSPEKVKSPNDIFTILNENNLSDLYTTTLTNYFISGIISKDMISRLGEALDVEYLLYTRLLTGEDYVYNEGASVIAKIDEIYVQSQVWDAKTGETVWEGKGGTAKLNINDTDIIANTAESLSMVIGTNSKDGPCEDRGTLVNLIETNRSPTWLVVLFTLTAVVAVVFVKGSFFP